MYTNPRLLKYLAIGLVAIGVLAGGLLVPVRQERVISFGIDSFETHQRLFAQRVLSQQASTQGQLVGMGVILVDLLRADQLVDVQVTIRSVASGEELGQATILASSIKDDQFARALFPATVTTTAQDILIELTAPQASLENPVGVRLNPQQTDGNNPRYENGRLKEGTLAILLTEKVPLWRYLATNIVQYEYLWLRSAAAVLLVFAIFLVGSQIVWQKMSERKQAALQIGILICLAALALNSYLAVTSQFKGVSGGDPYNYLFITESISRFQNPFEGVKRLPGYPLLLLPAFLSPNIDDIVTMRVLSAVSAAASLVILGLLAKSLHLPWPVQLIAPLLLAWQKDFFWTATRPEPYSFYAFLLLTALVLFFNSQRPWQQILYGLVLGYAAMTRQEGFVLAIVLGSASVIRLIYYRRVKKYNFRRLVYKLLRMYLPALVLVLPFFINNTFHFGNPIYTPYFEGERLQIVDSWGSFKDSVGAAWGVIGSTWRPTWDQLERYELTDRIFVIALLAGLLWSLPWSQLTKKISSPFYLPGILSLLVLLFIILSSTFGQVAFRGMAPPAIAAVLLISPLFFVWKTSWRGVLVCLVLITQMLIATWFHPFAKHFQQSYPLMALLLATILMAPALNSLSVRRKFSTIALSSSWLAAFFVISWILFGRLEGFIDKTNAATALDSVVYRAVQAARRLPEPHAIGQAHLPARLYLNENVHFFNEESATYEREQSWLNTNNIQTLIVVNDLPIFTRLPSNWQEAARFKSEGRDERVFESAVYTKQE